MKRKKTVHIIGLIIAAIFAGTLMTVPAFADGGVYLSENEVTVNVGETAYIAISVDNATGAYVVTSDGNASANGSGWLDNESAMIGIYGATEGSGTVTIRFDTLATYDEEELDGTTMTVHVNVVNPEGGVVEPDKGNEETPPAQPEEAPPVEEETTTTAPAVETPVKDPLQVSINGVPFTVLNDLNGVTLPAGFSAADASYNGTPVKVAGFQDLLTLYVLRSSDGAVVFKTLNKQNNQFEDPKILVQNGITYYLVDISPSEKIPSGYGLKDVNVNGFTVKGLVPEKNGQTDFCYVRGIADGSVDYYSYDVKQNSLQRIPELPSTEKSDADAEDAKDKIGSLFENTKLLKIALIAAGVVVIALIVVIIILAVRRKKNKRHDPDDDFDDFVDDDDFDDDDFADDEYEREFAKEDFRYGRAKGFPFDKEEENPDYVEEPVIEEPEDRDIEDIFDEDTWNVK